MIPAIAEINLEIIASFPSEVFGLYFFTKSSVIIADNAFNALDTVLKEKPMVNYSCALFLTITLNSSPPQFWHIGAN